MPRSEISSVSDTLSRQPPRPALPPALYALAASMASAHAVLAAGGVAEAADEALTFLRENWQGFVACGCVLALAVVWHRVHRRCTDVRHRRWLSSPTAADALVGILLVGVAAASAAGTSLAMLASGNDLITALAEGPLDAWDLTVTSDPSRTNRGEWRCRVHASRVGAPEGDLWLTTSATCEIGDVVHVSNGLTPNSDDEWGRINRTQGVWGRLLPKGDGVLTNEGPRGYMRLVRWLRDRARDVIAPYTSEGRAILAGCVIGDRRAMDELGLSEVFSACGVSHLIAVSGGHIVIMGQVLALLLDRTRLRPAPRLALLAVLSGVYVLLTGAPSPATRSWVMAVVGYGAQVVGRRSDALSAVSLVGLAMVLLNPGNVGQIGFVLSIVCVGALCLFAGYLTHLLGAIVATSRPTRLPRGVWRRVSGARDTTCATLGATLVAQMATAPVTIPLFMQLSLVAPLANVVLTMPFTLLIGLGLVAACVPIPAPIATILLAPCDLVATAVMGALRCIAVIPFASIPCDLDAFGAAVVAVTLGATLLITWPRITRARAIGALGAACALAAALVIRWGVLAPARIVVLDVGQGDAILVQDGAAAILVDAGPDDAVRAALARNHVLRLDAVIITHLHDDHYGGVSGLTGFVDVGRIIVADGVGAGDGGDATTYNGRNLAGLRRAVASLTGSDVPDEVGYGDVVRVGNFTLRVVWPHAPVTGNENAESIELAVSYTGGDARLTALLTGDAERDETLAVIAANDVGDIDLLKVGHHGSAVSVDTAAARTLAPEVAVASAGEANRYGHPTQECVDTLEGVGAQFLCTKDVGDVCVEPAVGGVRVSCQHATAS